MLRSSFRNSLSAMLLAGGLLPALALSAAPANAAPAAKDAVCTVLGQAPHLSKDRTVVHVTGGQSCTEGFVWQEVKVQIQRYKPGRIVGKWENFGKAEKKHAAWPKKQITVSTKGICQLNKTRVYRLKVSASFKGLSGKTHRGTDTFAEAKLKCGKK